MKTPPIAVREGQTIPVRALVDGDFDASLEKSTRRRITALSRQLQKNLALRELPLTLVEDDELQMRIRGIAGTLKFGNVEIEVSPKFTAPDAEAERAWRANLLLMLERSSPRPTRYTRSHRVRLEHRTLLDQFAFAFAVQLRSATSGAPIRQYVTVAQQSKYLRGRLRVSDQLRAFSTRPDLIWSDIDELDTQNAHNDLLLWVGQQLLHRVRSAEVRRELSAEIAGLPPTSPVPPAPNRLLPKLARQYVHYEGAINLAESYVRGKLIFPGVASVEGAAFLVGTERLYESFIENSLYGIASAKVDDTWSVVAQARELFATGVRHKRNYFSKPDNVLNSEALGRLIVDAKYKSFSEATDGSSASKPSNADLYQMAAACLAHKADRALLLYPRKDPSDEQIEFWAITWWEIPVSPDLVFSVGAASVDLSLLQDPDSAADFDSKLEVLLALGLNGVGIASAYGKGA